MFGTYLYLLLKVPQDSYQHSKTSLSLKTLDDVKNLEVSSFKEKSFHVAQNTFFQNYSGFFLRRNKLFKFTYVLSKISKRILLETIWCTKLKNDLKGNLMCNMSKAHVTDGLPWPLQNARKLGVHFSESLYPYKDKINNKIFFQLPDSELPAKRYSHFSLNGP